MTAAAPKAPSAGQQQAERLLVIKLSALGDFILALGAMEAIRRHHPQAHITLLTTAPFADIAGRSGYFDAVGVFPRAPLYDLPEWSKLFRFLNTGSFSRVYDLQLNGRTKLYYRLFRKKPEWSGVVAGASHFYANPAWRQMHAFARHKAMLAELGLEARMPDLSWMAADTALFGLKSPYVLLIPGSAPSRPDKRWPALKYGALALKLMREGYDVALLGTEAEHDVISRILKAAPGAKDLSGRTSLYDIAALARGAVGAVGNDTGPSHLIALCGCPLLALFSGASSPEFSAPVGPAVSVIQSENLEDVSVEDVMKHFSPRA
jgi:ADP-heptose:LPS heptosyltransferase